MKVKRYNAYFEPDPRMMREEEFGSYVYATDYDELLALARGLRKVIEDERDFEDEMFRKDGCDCAMCKVLRDSAWLEE